MPWTRLPPSLSPFTCLKQQEHHATEKDKLYGEAIAMRKKYETAQADLARMELQFQRINNEKQKLLTSHGSSSGEIMRLKDQVMMMMDGNDRERGREG